MDMMRRGLRLTNTLIVAAGLVAAPDWSGGLQAAQASRAPDGVHRTFSTPDAAVTALMDALKAGSVEQVIAVLGPDSADLIVDPGSEASRRNREVFIAAASEGWRLADQGANQRTLIVGNEAWPFPVPVVQVHGGWQFDTAAGRAEVLARRIGRNELAAINVCRTFVAAQQQYASEGHDGKPAGRYAMTLRSDTGRQNGLYWPVARGGKRGPLGDLVAAAAPAGHALDPTRPPLPFHGYYFKILTAAGPNAPGGAKSYVVD